MNFLIDAHLPVSLIRFFEGHDVLHTSDLELKNSTPDNQINDLSILEKRIVITKDNDFYYSFTALQKPYKLILVKLGNIRLGELIDYFERNSATMIDLIKDNSFLILETDRIRILS